MFQWIKGLTNVQSTTIEINERDFNHVQEPTTRSDHSSQLGQNRGGAALVTEAKHKNWLIDWESTNSCFVNIFSVTANDEHDEHDEPLPTFVNHYHPLLVITKHRQPLSTIASQYGPFFTIIQSFVPVTSL